MREPIPNIQEALFISYVENQNKAHGVPEESCGKTSESLLSGSVPELQKDSLAPAPEATSGTFVNDFFLLEIDADGRYELTRECIVRVPVLKSRENDIEITVSLKTNQK